MMTKTKTKKPTVPVLTTQEKTLVAGAANRTFDYIAGDMLQLIQEVEGRPYLMQSEVIEMVLDAHRLETIGRLDKKLANTLYALPYKQLDAVFRTIFPAKRYS